MKWTAASLGHQCEPALHLKWTLALAIRFGDPGAMLQVTAGVWDGKKISQSQKCLQVWQALPAGALTVLCVAFPGQVMWTPAPHPSPHPPHPTPSSKAEPTSGPQQAIGELGQAASQRQGFDG